MPFQVRIAALVLAIGTVFYSGWYVRDLQATSDAYNAAQETEQTRKRLAAENKKIQAEAQRAREKDNAEYAKRIKNIYKKVAATRCLDESTRVFINQAAARASREASGIDGDDTTGSTD